MSTYRRPPKVAVPPEIDTSPSSMRSVVVLPEPLGPRKPVTLPGATSNLRSSTARTGPKCLDSPRISMADAMSDGTPWGLPRTVKSLHPGRMAYGRRGTNGVAVSSD